VQNTSRSGCVAFGYRPRFGSTPTKAVSTAHEHVTNKGVRQLLRVESSAVINRPVEDVFAAVSNVENNPKWSSVFLEAKKFRVVPLGVGTTWDVVKKALGQQIEGSGGYRIRAEPAMGAEKQVGAFSGRSPADLRAGRRAHRSVAAEMSSLNKRERVYPQTVLYSVLAFLALVAFGVALLRTGLAAGWLTVIWNLARLVVLPIISRRDIYYPGLHHAAPLLIGIARLRQG
jgi:hypothetical protein